MIKIIELLENWIFIVVSGIFLVLSFVFSKLNINTFIDFAWVTIVISGIPLLYSAIKKLIFNSGIKKISSALLITIAMIASILIKDIFAAGEVAWIMAVGELLEHVTTKRARRGIKKLIELSPTQARRIIGDTEELVSLDKVEVGDIIRILPGETIPIDGYIISGETSVNQSVITGESLPVDKLEGDEVFCGTINCYGAIDVKTTKVGNDSSLQKIIELMKNAENHKAKTQRVADKWASYLVPIAFLVAVIGGVITQNIVVAVTVLVVFCPCSLVLATPTAIMAAIGQATKQGIIIKSGEALESMSKVDIITFDKTGTLTYGKLEVSDVISFSEDYSNNDLLKYIASAESKSEHPIGKAIVSFAKMKEIQLMPCDEFSMIIGKGIVSNVNGQNIICGNESILKDNNIDIPSDKIQIISTYKEEGKSCNIVAINGFCVGLIVLSDKLRNGSVDTILELNQMKTEVVLLTGDNEKSAKYFADKVKIDKIYANLLPENKVQKIEELKNDNHLVCMLGDGVNDAPALNLADVGVSMGGIGSDISVDTSDIVFMNDDISKLPYLKWLANETVKTIKFSIILSMTINFVAIILSLLQLLSPTIGALVHNAGSCFVVLFSALLYDRKYKNKNKEKSKNN